MSDAQSGTLDDVWGALVSAALLGTDRRDPPALPDGLLADVVADAVRRTALAEGHVRT